MIQIIIKLHNYYSYTEVTLLIRVLNLTNNNTVLYYRDFNHPYKNDIPEVAGCAARNSIIISGIARNFGAV